MSTLRTIAQKKYGIAALDVDDRHEKAVRAGIFERVSEYDDESFKFPIPSFYTFMQCDLDRIHDQFLEKMLAQIAAESHRWSESKRLGR